MSLEEPGNNYRSQNGKQNSPELPICRV